VSEILQPGANDVWVIKRQGKKDLLLPFIDDVILSVDIAGNQVTVEIPEGLDD
ncbi:MAG: PRC-barrel domain-containing protein, partial [Lactococcus raffinolactis]